MRAALLTASGRVDNLILISADSEYTPDKGLTLVILDENDSVNIGDLWDGGNWTPPEVTEPEVPDEVEPPEPTLEEQIAELKATVDMLLLMSLEG